MRYEGPKTAAELAAALGMTPAWLEWLTLDRKADTGTHYRHFAIKKRNGSPRFLAAPKRHMRGVQRKALRLVWDLMVPHAAAHGFVKGRSIVTNATRHAGASVLVKLDVRHFFPSIKARRVAGWLRVKAGVPGEVAELLARLSTEPPRRAVRRTRRIVVFVASGPRALPQGAPTSPAITNALCRRLDRRLTKLANRLRVVYTRYADDLTFSWHGPAVEAPVDALLCLSSAIVRAEGFRVNTAKTRVVRPGARLAVTGLVVNGAPGVELVRVPRETHRRIRAGLYNLEHGRTSPDSIDTLRGLASFVYDVEPAKGRFLLDRLTELERLDSARANP